MARKNTGAMRAERKAVRALARTRTRAERVRLAHWIPEERARVRRQIALARAGLKVTIAGLRSKLATDVRLARERSRAKRFAPGSAAISRKRSKRKPQAAAARRSKSKR